MANKPVYWAELPALWPGHYRHRTALSKAFTLQVSGSLSGTRQRAVLYRVAPEGRLVRTWSQRFEVRKGTAPGSARYKSLRLLLDAAESDPKIAGRVTVTDIIDGARNALASEQNAE